FVSSSSLFAPSCVLKTSLLTLTDPRPPLTWVPSRSGIVGTSSAAGVAVGSVVPGSATVAPGVVEPGVGVAGGGAIASSPPHPAKASANTDSMMSRVRVRITADLLWVLLCPPVEQLRLWRAAWCFQRERRQLV